ncbi:MAG: hypothetical protein K2H76_06055, partial [Muribaculaceae bacterium]|nr:hypothetical protein [Muribaculaceae bacterium]
NDMGPYAQTNSYAGGSVGDMAGWEKKGRSVKTIYNDVCRLLVGGVNGVSNSLPGEMVSGEQYSYSTKIDISGIKAEKFILIPFIVDSFTGNIMNSKVIEVENSYFAGVDEIGTDSTLVSRKFYNLNGVEVKDPSNGIYVVRSVYSDGTIKTEKAALK